MLSENIRKLRKENNMSQDELAEKLDVSRQCVSLWENGQTQPTVENVIALAKIFNVSANELLGEETGAPATAKSDPEPPPKRRLWWLAIVIPAAVLTFSLFVGLAIWGIGKIGFSMIKKSSAPETTVVSPTEETVTPSENEETKHTPATTEPTKPTEPVEPTKSETPSTGGETFDLYAYCKQFAIEKGILNGDYVIYQQPSGKYGGYENEYFSITYWAGYDKVEFCLHCPLSETQSINFYLNMRGGFDGTYEYSTSKYYRDTGDSIRSADGYIDPSVFSEHYPLNCSEYFGSTEGQSEFMEESRVGICDLIKLLKRFTVVENMECGFDAFGFVNF